MVSLSNKRSHSKSRTRSSLNGISSSSRSASTSSTSRVGRSNRDSTFSQLQSQSQSQSMNGHADGDVDRHGGFKKGCIIRIKLKDFMTYKDVQVFSGPYLNLVLGPNGTGKSALVCATIIGLGGDPSTTGRAGSIGEYIRFGCETALVEIELYNDRGKNYIVQRQITCSSSRGKTEYHSTFRIDGKEVPKKEVSEFMRGLNIRVDNLCQFLPQERVIEFVKMDQKTLLENTERAAGDVQMFDLHMQAVELSKEITTLKSNHSTLNRVIETENQIQERAEDDIRKIQEREKMIDDMEWLEKKKPWLHFEEKRQAYEKAKEDFAANKKKLIHQEAHLNPLKKKVEDKRKEYQKWEKEVRLNGDKVREIANEIKGDNSKLERIVEKSEQLKSEYEVKLDQEQKRKSKVNDAQASLRNLKSTYDQLEEVDVENDIVKVNEKILKLNEKIGQISDRKGQIDTKLDEMSRKEREAKRVLEEIENVFKKKLDCLRENSNDSYKAYEWLKRNEDKFSKKIYPPIMTQINVKKKEWIKYVETAIPKKDLYAFVCEDRDDLKLFTELIQQELNLRVTVAMAPEQGLEHFQPEIPISSLSKYGIFSYVKDMFSAPPAVMAHLCKLANLNNVPVGNEKTDSAIKVLATKENFKRIYSKETAYNFIKSTYDNEVSTKQFQIQPPRFLSISIDEEEKKRASQIVATLREQIMAAREELKSLQDERQKIDDEMGDLRVTKQALYNKRNQKKDLAAQMKMKEDTIKLLEKQAINVDELKRKTREELRKCLEVQAKLSSKMIEHIELCVEKQKARMKSSIGETVSRKRSAQLDKELNLAQQSLRGLKEEIVRLESQVQVIKHEAIALRAVAVQKTGMDPSKMSQAIRDRFDELPDTLEEVDAKIEMLKLRINSVMDIEDSEQIQEEYNKRQEFIKNKKSNLERNKKELKLRQTKLDDVKTRWLPSLEELIGKINSNFSVFMSRLGCAGQIALFKGEEEAEDQFDDYGISIRVKFRDTEQLKELSSFHQSGGERSVSTMVYMIALQELTKVPFRCVDEINQGMDESNERSVFDLISETSSRNASQYFLFSPKLLPNLTYTDKMKIHIIFNGPLFNVDWTKVTDADADDDDTEDDDGSD